MSAHQERLFIDRAMERISKAPMVLDMGGGEPFGKWLKTYENLFKNCEYKSFDFDATTGADIVGDIHAIPLADNTIDAIICSSVLEHVKNPVQAAKELKRILKPGGQIFFYVPSIYPYHARKGHYPDLWRFFDDTMQQLFEGYSQTEIAKRGGYFSALSFFVPKQHAFRWFLDPAANFLDAVFQTKRRTTTAGYYVYAVK